MQLSKGALEELVGTSLGRWCVPGAVVGVLREGRREAHALGLADLRSGAPLTAEATQRIASITKPFTATLALSLAGDGLLDLDVPVPLGPRTPGITLRRLLTHTAGLEGELGDLARFGDGDDALGLAVAEARRLQSLVDPGECWSYSNAGYWIAGAVCAERAGTTYEEALADRVLDLLGLARTSFRPPDATGHVERVPGTLEHEPADERPYPRARRPSGGLTSTAFDLLRFAEAHLGDEPAFRLTAPEIATPRGAYALGWAVTTHGGTQVWSHDGAYGGFQSRLAVVPERNAAFVVLTNGDAGAAVVREVTSFLLETMGLPVDEPATVALAHDALDRLCGRYAGSEVDALVERTDSRLLVGAVAIDPVTGERTAQPPVEARAIGGRRFAIVGGVWDGQPFDFLPDSGPVRFLRLAGRLVPRV